MKRLGSILLWLVLALAVAAAGRSMAGEADDSTKSPGKVSGLRERRYVYLRLHGPVLERLPLVYLFPPKTPTLRDITQLLEKARKDPQVKGIFVHLGQPRLGWARAQELRRALNRCRTSGKRVVCFMDGGGNQEYYIGSVADRLGIVPTSQISLVGIRAEVMFFKGLLDKVGVRAQFVQIGQFKGAAEPFTRESMSEPFRQSMEVLLDDFYAQLVGDIAQGRDLKADIVRALIDRGPYDAEGAREAGLVDDVLYYDEFLGRLGSEAPGPLRIVRNYVKKRSTSLDFSSPQQMMNLLMGMARPRGEQIPTAGSTIAVIYALGPIVMDDEGDIFGEPAATAKKLVQAFRFARRHPRIKAVVLRVNSPGGSALASDIIWHEIVRTDQAKPVIVSLSDVAGSGGYYVAVGGRLIVAEPGSITGSIGVVGGKFNLKGLYDKLGLSVEVIQRGRNAGLYSSISDFSEAERARVVEMMQGTYRDFVKRVAAGRKKDVEEIEAVAQGRAWSGARAVRVGLVDRLGGLDEAIEIARKQARIPEKEAVHVVELPRSKNIIEALLSGAGLEPELKAPSLEALGLPVTVPVELRVLTRVITREHVAWMLPLRIEIH
jgi:protease-4